MRDFDSYCKIRFRSLAHFITKSHPLKNVAGNIEMRSILDINHSNLLCIGILLIKVKICGMHLFIET